MSSYLDETLREYNDAFLLVRDALENAVEAFNELQEYPITHAACDDALSVVQYILKRDFCDDTGEPLKWNITVPDVKRMVDAINNPHCCSGDCNQGRNCPNRKPK